MDVVVVPGEFVKTEWLSGPTVPRVINRRLPDDPGDIGLTFVVKEQIEYLLPNRGIYVVATPGAVPNVETNIVVIPCYFFFGRVIKICIAPHVVFVYEVPGPLLN